MTRSALPPHPAASLLAAILLGCVGLTGCSNEPQPPPVVDAPAPWAPPAADLDESEPRPDPVLFPAVEAADEPLPVARPRDREPPLPPADRLAAFGLTRIDGDRLTVVTDRPEHAEELPALIDAAWPAWVDYFGEPPPRRSDEGDAGALMIAFLMEEPDRFRSAGLLPDDLPPFLTGRQRGRRFWMYDVEEDYFRRALTLHEATHVFMGLHVDRRDAGPLWYLEGMAERFGAHRVEPDGTLTVRVVPGEEAAAGGWDRLERVRADVAADAVPSLDGIARLTDADFLGDDRGYAWAWGLCAFLDGHPAYAETFRTLAEPGRRGELSAFDPVRRQIEAEWRAFATELVPGYDVAANVVRFEPAPPGPVAVAADGCWQNAGVRVERGGRVRVSATGRFTLAEEPKPWESTADGVSVDYHRGRRIGELQAAVLADAPAPPIGLAEPIPVGAEGAFVAPRTGTLYLRINDRPDRRADNRGGVSARIELN